MLSVFADTILLPADKRKDRLSRLFVYLTLVATAVAVTGATMTLAYGYQQLAVAIYAAAFTLPFAIIILHYSASPFPAGHYLAGNLIIQTMVFAADPAVGCITLTGLAAGAALLGPGGRLWLGVILLRCVYVAATQEDTNASATAAVAGMMALSVFVTVAASEASRNRAQHRERVSEVRNSSTIKVLENLILKHFDAYIVVDQDSILFATHGIESLLGYTPGEIRARPLSAYLHPDETEKQLLLQGERMANRAELRLRHRNGQWVWVELYASPDFTRPDSARRIMVMRNYEQQRKVSDQLTQAQRLESMGAMGAAVAHDFNNMLTVILGFADTLPGGEARDEIIRVTTNAANLTDKLLNFAAGHRASHEIQDLSYVMRQQSQLIRHTLDARFILMENYQEDPVLVRIAEPQVVQVLLNLVNNAREAMPEGGELEITLETVDLARGKGDPPSGHAHIEVRDTGEGMDSNTQRTAFDPFFSTRANRHNTGLGLSSCYGIVAQYGGFMDIESSVDSGTTVHVWLPLAEPMTDEDPVEASPTGNWVMVVDDEPSVMLVVRNALMSAGLPVRGFIDTQEALEFFRANQVSAVVTDIVMPRESGVDMVNKMRHLKPDVPVLFISGFSNNELNQTDLNLRTMFLAKPFRSGEVVEKVQSLLAHNRLGAHREENLS